MQKTQNGFVLRTWRGNSRINTGQPLRQANLTQFLFGAFLVSFCPGSGDVHVLGTCLSRGEKDPPRACDHLWRDRESDSAARRRARCGLCHGVLPRRTRHSMAPCSERRRTSANAGAPGEPAAAAPRRRRHPHGPQIHRHEVIWLVSREKAYKETQTETRRSAFEETKIIEDCLRK
jgi:hypothetical protein